jgi:hypothetical protein
VDIYAEHRSLVGSATARACRWAEFSLGRKFSLAALPEHPTLFRVLHTVEEFMEAKMGRGILLWLLGVPIPVIILLWLFFGR